MTYFQFLLVFIVPLCLVGLYYFKRSRYPNKKDFLQGMLLLMGIAVVYTTPWDNYLVKTGVWSYEEHNVLFRIGYVPFEEYCFFVLQTIMTSCWFLYILSRNKIEKAPQTGITKHWVTAAFASLFVASLFMLQSESSRYLGLILVWVTPVFLLQWIVGGQHLLWNFKVYLFGLMPPTVYLWLVDNYAIAHDIWRISTLQTVGLKFSHLPLEEAVFFLGTNMMLGQGLILYLLLKKDFALRFARPT